MSELGSMISNAERAEVAFHNRLAVNWEQKYQKRSFARRAECLLGLLGDTALEGTSWLDAGCGTGHLSRELARRGCWVTGVDAAPSMIEVARELTARSSLPSRPQFETISTVEALPMGDTFFDGVICSSVVEYLPDPRACLAAFCRVLKPGGLLLVSVPNRNSVFRRSLVLGWECTKFVGDRNPLSYMVYSVNEYSLAGFSRILKEHGFSTLKCNFTGTSLPAWLDRSGLVGTLINVLARRTG